MRQKKLRFVVIAVVLIAVASVGYIAWQRSDSQMRTNLPTGSSTSTQNEATEAGFDKTRYSIDDPSSIWVIANKERPLSAEFQPDDLIVPNVRLRLAATEQQMQFRAIAEKDLFALFEAAEKDNVTLVFGSGFRSYQLQKQFYDGYVARDGQAAANRYSAQPGTSEHQTGLSFDATNTKQSCHLEVCFADTPEGAWLAKHAHEYGFTLRYRDGKEAVTGYQYEPWHFRYVGTELATLLYEQNTTLEEFFEL